MRMLETHIEGSAGWARISREGSGQIRIETENNCLLHRRQQTIDGRDKKALEEAAEALQFGLDGYLGTHGDIYAYYCLLEKFTN